MKIWDFVTPITFGTPLANEISCSSAVCDVLLLIGRKSEIAAC